MKVFLASASPRRKELMSLLPYKFDIYVPNFDEESYKKELEEKNLASIEEICIALASKKGEVAYRDLLNKYKDEDILVVSADTIVVLDKEIFGKGKNESISFEMLKRLNGKKHIVMTGVSLYYKGENISFIDKSEVYFANSDDKLIKRYIEEYKPFDKAGAYGIQDGGGLLVEKISGSYHNIVGLPIRKVYEKIEKILDIQKYKDEF